MKSAHQPRSNRPATFLSARRRSRCFSEDSHVLCALHQTVRSDFHSFRCPLPLLPSTNSWGASTAMATSPSLLTAIPSSPRSATESQRSTWSSACILKSMKGKLSGAQQSIEDSAFPKQTEHRSYSPLTRLECPHQHRRRCVSRCTLRRRVCRDWRTDGRSLLVNFRTATVLHHFNFKKPVRDIQFSPDGQCVSDSCWIAGLGINDSTDGSSLLMALMPKSGERLLTSLENLPLSSSIENTPVTLTTS